MWTNLEIDNATIEDIFQPINDKAKEYERPWSIAELLLTEDDIRWLKAWFRCLTPNNTINWVKSMVFTKLEDKVFVSYRQMFGSILICAATEACREESREDSVWPAIREILGDSPELQTELFLSNGQPSSLTKDMITDSVRALNLRHAMDIEGTQQWFTTIKLQFGFTYRGAKDRLAEWLVNISRPHVVQYLLGDSDFPELASKSFQSLWRALEQYRHGIITESEIQITLKGNPWVKAHWINDILNEARARISIIENNDWHTEKTDTSRKYNSAEEFCPIRDIALDWPLGKTPRVRFQLNQQAIEDEVRATNVGELDFYVDGRKLCRWLRQQDGTWAGSELIFAEPETFRQQPNLHPKTLSIQTAAGDALIEWDFAYSGLSEDVLVFDLDKQKIINASYERLEANRHYAIVCDQSFEIKGCNSVETFSRNNIRRKAVRLPSLLNQNLCIVYEDFILWQPVREERYQRPHFSITLSTPTTELFSLNDRAKLCVMGLPEDAKAVRLLIHTKTYDLEPTDEGWRTTKEITITAEIAARQQRVRVCFLSGDRAYTQEPRLALSLLGAAIIRNQQEENAEISFEVLKEGKQLNRSEGTINMKIWTPVPRKGAQVLEGHYQVGRLRHQKIKLKDFPGNGGQIHVNIDGLLHNLGINCIDTGCVQKFVPSMLGCDAQLLLLSDKNPKEAADDGYALHLWFIGENQKGKFIILPANSIQKTSKNRLWKIRIENNPMAVALSWKGSWLGAWWSCERISEYLCQRTDLSENEFAILKWIRVPVLDSRLFTTLKRLVLNVPCRFIKTWLTDSGLPQGIKPHYNILGLDSVVRCFLWNDFPVIHADEAIGLITREYKTWHDIYSCIENLQKLSEISPRLLWKGLEHCIDNDMQNIIYLSKTFIRAQVGLPSTAPEYQVKYRIRDLEKRLLSYTSLSEEKLEKVVGKCILSCKITLNTFTNRDRGDLLRLSETQLGRKYLAVQLVKHWIKLSGT